ncbi:hypothetical protein Taro_015024 [Colocasia esculenta]|uniref:Uncharacterized protein n=1 Tax=Colocasia esculenta TaxID=4460 RepID=A0A843UJT2_COLES|nr:hypothetical protein [Colocasia esculenta]
MSLCWLCQTRPACVETIGCNIDVSACRSNLNASPRFVETRTRPSPAVRHDLNAPLADVPTCLCEYDDEDHTHEDGDEQQMTHKTDPQRRGML